MTNKKFKNWKQLPLPTKPAIKGYAATPENYELLLRGKLGKTGIMFAVTEWLWRIVNTVGLR